MSLWQDPGLRRSLGRFAAVSAAAILAGFLMEPRLGLWTAAVCLLLTALHIWEIRRRHRTMARLSQELTRALHDTEALRLEQFQEGELAILQCQLQKLTTRLLQQAEALTREKTLLSDTLADISHQLRTPLTSIRLVVTLLSQEGGTEERRLELIRELRRLLSRVDWLIEALLKLSRLDAGTVRMVPELLDAAELVRQAAQPLAIPMELREQTLEIRGGGQVLADPHWTVEAIGNVLKNCAEHTPDGGRLSAQIRETPIFTELRFSDTGPGIAPEDLPHLFERFYRGRNAAEGSIGIGLALSRTILSAQNAAIKAQNDPHGGARFTIRFYSNNS